MDTGAPPSEPGGGAARRVLRRAVELLRPLVLRGAAAGRALWARRPSSRRALAGGFVAAALATGVLSILAQARLAARLPSARDWAAVAALLERDARPGDAVALSPSWAERARAVLPPSVPVFANARWNGEDLLGVRRLWLLSIPDAPGFSWSAETELLQRTAQPRPPERIGAFRLGRLDLAAPALPLAFLPDRLAEAEVSRGEGGCPRDATGVFRCPGGSVSRDVRDVGGAPRPCVVAALGEGEPLVIAFPPVRVGRSLRGHGGPVGDGAAPLRVSVVVDDEEAGSAEIAAGHAFAPFEVDTARFAGDGRRVSLVLTPAGAGAVCLDAVTLP